MVEIKCTYKAQLLAKDHCEFVKEYCSGSGIFNQWFFNYCAFNETLWQTMVIGVLIIALCFYILQTTADKWLTPLLKNLSTKLKLPETVAGVTLIAFANGAPDIVTAISAGGSEEGTFISIGSLVGACLFGSSVIIARSIILSPKLIKMQLLVATIKKTANKCKLQKFF